MHNLLTWDGCIVHAAAERSIENSSLFVAARLATCTVASFVSVPTTAPMTKHPLPRTQVGVVAVACEFWGLSPSSHTGYNNIN